MQQEITDALRRLKMKYILLWALVAGIVCIGEFFGDYAGLYADRADRIYYGETVAILLTVTCIPAGLKLFAWALRRRINDMGIKDALRSYTRWCGIRLALIALPLYYSILAYYLMLSSKYLLCACIALLASLFCVPTTTRLYRELAD